MAQISSSTASKPVLFCFFIAAFVSSVLAFAPAPAPAPETGSGFSLWIPGALVGLGFLLTALVELRN
ncbi:hypothetical protein R6Q59_017700 [Mikania micrantha]